MKPKKKSAAASSSSSSSLGAQHSSSGGGVSKRTHSLAKKKSMQHALLPQLQAEAASAHKRAAKKDRQKRAGSSTIAGAMDGIRATLDELLAANEQHHKSAAAEGSANAVLTSKKRQKMVADETQHMQRVLEHPAFIADPFAALAEHLKNTVGAPTSKEAKAAATRVVGEQLHARRPRHGGPRRAERG